MNCLDCKYAQWDRTKNGRLHPDGEGRCTVEVKLPTLPLSMYWIGGPIPRGGMISRREIHRFEGCQRWNKA